MSVDAPRKILIGETKGHAERIAKIFGLDREVWECEGLGAAFCGRRFGYMVFAVDRVLLSHSVAERAYANDRVNELRCKLTPDGVHVFI